MEFKDDLDCKDDPKQAASLVDPDNDTLSRQNLNIEGASRFGNLILFTKEEQDQFKSFEGLVKQFLEQRTPLHPLSLGVFGPPGSGKSFAVKQLRQKILDERKEKEEKEKKPKLELPYTVVNLTQVSDSGALARVLARIAGEQGADGVPIIFFDEFDAPRNNIPYGWLSWFLAPMQDGQFLHDGAVIRLQRAIYIFAGGTAATMDQFSNFQSLPDFRYAKGPDFVSRLHGFLNISGPNSAPAMMRRAVLLRSELDGRAKRNGSKKSPRPDEKLLDSLLRLGRYRHGARSIAALVELSNLGADKSTFSWEDLPSDHLLRLHLDRGPLDSKLIGGSIALSGFVSEKSDANQNVNDCWSKVADRLWREGATLAFAANWGAGMDQQLVKSLVDDLKKRPTEPSVSPVRRESPAPWLEGFVHDGPEERRKVDSALSIDKRTQYGLRLNFRTLLTEEESKLLPEWLIKVIERFRRRLAVSEISVARFVIAGENVEHRGRFPGIAEEVMLTLARGVPIYLAGGFGGAAADVGSLLGLAHPRTGEVPISLHADPEKNDPLLDTIAHKLRPTPWTNLPLRGSELVSFLKDHAIGGPKWPRNGLTPTENRELFDSRDCQKIVSLVTKGLLRRFNA